MQEIADTSRPPFVKVNSLENEETGGDESGCNRQVQYINHIFPATGDDSKTVCFIITNMFQQIHITIKNYQESVS